MAIYKNPKYLTQLLDSSFDKIHEASTLTPISGIYRCEGCGHEIVSVKYHRLPPQNHHQHKPEQGKIRWRLIVSGSHQ